jgi:alkanesulfonate monooxygenase SsuD/methylene tetrahydromethanopterin reductase-like flavin-dependent oxidoreductase (luciferase family)
MGPPKVRVDRMIEHTKILQDLFAGKSVTFPGEHYDIADLDLIPGVFTPGGPPILIGGGARRVLRFAGATADIVGVTATIRSGEIDVEAGHDGLPDRVDEKLVWVREGAGPRFDDLEINAWLAFAEVSDDTTALVDGLAALFQTEPAAVVASPLVLIGSRGEIADRLEERRERWNYSYQVIPADQAHDFAPIVAELTGR